MKLVMNRNITVTGLSGHSIRYEKGVPQYTPPPLIELAMSKGGVPEDGEMLPEVVEEAPPPAPVGLGRKEQLFQIFDELVAENTRAKFSAGGVPKIGPVRDMFNHELDTRELKATWKEWQTARLSPEE
jgi:hypothetical protein